MSVTVDIEVKDGATQRVNDLLQALSGTGPRRRDFMAAVAGHAERFTSDYIRTIAAPHRHKTATRLGATPTGYLERRAQNVESRSNMEEAVVIIAGAPEIFARAFGPVTVRARNAKNLTIPLTAEAYGRRAGEFSDLFPITSRRGNKLLVRRDGKLLKAYYLLKPQVTLSEDRGLLPTDERYGDVVALVADDFIETL